MDCQYNNTINNSNWEDDTAMSWNNDIINRLAKLRKSYMGVQGCSCKHQQENMDKAKLLSDAIMLIKQLEELKKFKPQCFSGNLEHCCYMAENEEGIPMRACKICHWRKESR